MRPLRLSEESTPEHIWGYYERSLAALQALRREVERDPDACVLFAGMTVSEFEEVLQETRRELDKQVTMALVASFEAVMRLDYWDRVSRRLRDQASKSMRELHKRR